MSNYIFSYFNDEFKRSSLDFIAKQAIVNCRRKIIMYHSM